MVRSPRREGGLHVLGSELAFGCDDGTQLRASYLFRRAAFVDVNVRVGAADDRLMRVGKGT